MTQSNTTFAPIGVSNGFKPIEGPKALPVPYDFSGTTTSYTTDLTFIKNQGKMSMVQTLFIDNSSNNGTLTVTCSGTPQVFALQPGAQGYYPVLVPSQAKFTVSSAGDVSANVLYINVEVPAAQWSATAVPISLSGTLPVSDTILDALVTGGRLPVLTTPAKNTDTNRSGTITLGGSSQTLMVANAARKGWMVMNIDETNLEEVGIGIAGAASIGSPGTFSLSASSGAGYPGGFMQGAGSGAITIIAATTGHAFTAIEW